MDWEDKMDGNVWIYTGIGILVVSTISFICTKVWLVVRGGKLNKELRDMYD
jgi:hypothetical protein